MHSPVCPRTDGRIAFGQEVSISTFSGEHVLPSTFLRGLSRKRPLEDRIAHLEHERDTLRGLMNEHASTVLAREAAIMECEAVVREREQTIAGYEDTICRYERVITGLEAAVRETDALRTLVGENADAVQVREAAVQEYESLARAREQTIAAYEETMRQQEDLIINLEAAARERNSLRDLVNEQVFTIQARETATLEREALLRMREATIEECVSAIRDREQTIAHHEGTLRRYEEVIRSLEATVHKQHHALGVTSKIQPSSGWAMQTVTPTDHQPFSQEAADYWIGEWRKVTAQYANVVLQDGQTLIEPYLLERVIHDRLGRLIIATVEGKGWYDNNNAIELPELLRLGMIRQGDTVFDCGSNQGVNALFYASVVGTAGKVYAFDPFSLNVDIGNFNARMNGADNIKFIRAGLSDQAARVVVPLGQQCVGVLDDTTPDAVEISLVPLDTFAALRPSFLKIDIEGAEVNALEGAREVLAQEPTIYIEVHPQFLPRFGRSPMDIFKHVSLDRYTCYIQYPEYPALIEYYSQFEMTEGCALYCVPKSRPVLTRHYSSLQAAV